MKLYLAPHACSFATHITALEAGIAFEPVWVDLRSKTLRDGSDFTQINPKGQVPALQTDDGQVLTEVAVILQYLADQRPQSGLLSPSLGMERYRVLEWANYVSSELHKNFGPLFRPNTPAEYRTIAIENLTQRFTFLDKTLAERQYLNGDAFTIADAYCYTAMAWAHFHKIDLAAWPNLAKYLDRVGQRAAVRKASEEQQAAAQ